MNSDDFERFYREEFGRIIAALIRTIGDFEVAEDAVQEAFAAAIEQWPRDGSPDNPRAWIAGVARNKAIDRLRRQSRFAGRSDELSRLIENAADQSRPADYSMLDERLSLIFTCCHPALAPEAQVALSLRTLCGLTTEEIARAFLVPPATMAQRLVRAKHKIRAAKIPYETPPRERMAERLDAVMAVVYLVFNEGYSASAGDSLVRRELASEAIRLGRLLAGLMPEEPEPRGLLAMMILHNARRAARVDADGDLVLLEDQDRNLWDRVQIEEGLGLADAAMKVSWPGPYAIQAAIIAEHARAMHASETDWVRIARLHDALFGIRPTPIVELNRAVAVAMAEEPEAGLRLIEALEARGELTDYYLRWSAKADLLRRMRRFAEAEVCYRHALELVGTEPERRFLQRRIAEVTTTLAGT